MMNSTIDTSTLEIWFATGSQDLYGEETLRQVEENSKTVAAHLAQQTTIPVTVIYKQTLTSTEEIYNLCQAANNSKNCIGIIAWMHTFSPAKMWIRGLNILQKPLLHFHTQFNRDIPWGQIDMDFMNLNQSAHGDREFGFIMSRMRLERKVVTGHWQQKNVIEQLAVWARAAQAWHDWQRAKFVRFGDNMRYVAVTDGDKVEAEIKFGYSVNTYGIGDLAGVINNIQETAVSALCADYEESYNVAQDLRKGNGRHEALRDAARIELGLRSFLEAGNYKGFTDTFEDLHGLLQLPGIATQRLMADGYGFGGEGDWKTAALVRAMKVMGHGLPGGNSFMEDYTYHFEPENEMVLGAHMLEICPSISSEKPRCEIHPLGIGGKADPVRLVFNVHGGNALNASIIDMGNRFRLLVNKVEAVAPYKELPNLPVARVLWKPLPSMQTACSAWILAGGAHHTCYSQNLTEEYLVDFSEMAGMEMLLIDEDTTIRDLKKELKWNDLFFQMKK